MSAAESDVVFVDQFKIDQLSKDVSEFYVIEMIQTYIDATTTSIAELVEAMKLNDVKTLEHSSHYLKGASGLLGLSAMEDLNQKIVIACRTSDVENAVMFAKDVQLCFDKTCEKLYELFPQIKK